MGKGKREIRKRKRGMKEGGQKREGGKQVGWVGGKGKGENMYTTATGMQ